MTTTLNNPWADIPVAQSGQSVRRRVKDISQQEVFWFRDDRGRPGLFVEISSQLSRSTLMQAKISIRDITIDVVEILNEGIRALTITLENDQNRDVFLKLCLDLIDHTAEITDSDELFSILCKRLKKWQSLLAGKQRNLLSANEIQGLYAELYFIAETLAGDTSFENILINGWEGPEQTQQDFILQDTAVEIKSVAGNQRGKVRISSEDQLETHLGKLYLRVYFLAESISDEDAESLNSIIRRITALLTETSNRDLFELKLNAAGYIDIPDYDFPLFRVKNCLTYLVSSDFPRITRATLPESIAAVTYDLVLAGIEKYRTHSMDITGK